MEKNYENADNEHIISAIEPENKIIDIKKYRYNFYIYII